MEGERPREPLTMTNGSRGRSPSRTASLSVLVDMTTTAPALAQEIAAAAAARGIAALDAPVSGGDVGARNATLSIMVGGDVAALATVQPLLALLGRTILHQGAAGAGQHAKLCNQIVIAGTMIGVCESLLYAARAGLKLETMLQSIRGGAAACWTLENLAPRILRRDFAPGFYVDHFVKDMGLALEEARRMNLPLPGLALVRELYARVQALGHGHGGTQALMLALEQMAAAGLAGAAAPGRMPGMAIIKQVAHVCLGAKDLAAAERFYCHALGLRKHFRFRKGDREFGFYLEAGPGNYLEIFEQPDAPPVAQSPLRHLCLEVDDIDAAITRLRSQGVEVSDKKLGCDDSWQCWLKDPTGIPIELHQYTPTSCQRTGRDCLVNW